MSREEMVKKFDKDGDGKLSEAERQEARKSMGGRPGMNREELMKKFDTNGDGKLDETERQAARAAMAKNRGNKDAGKGPKGARGKKKKSN